MTFFIKVLISSVLIAFSSWLAGKKPILAGFIIALPLISILSILLTYLEYRNMEKINEYAVSILAAVPLSLIFFIPFVINRWLKMNFLLTFGLGIGGLFLAYSIHQILLRRL